MKKRTELQLLNEYRKECKKNNKEISGIDFINNFIPDFLKKWWEIIIN